MRRAGHLGLFVATALALACSSSQMDQDADAGRPPDSGIDAGTGADTGLDAGVDESADAGSDAGIDAGADAGIDAGADAGIDAGADAGIDAGADAGIDAGADAGIDAGSADAGPRVDMIASQLDSPTSLALQSGTLYWAEYDSPGSVVGLAVDGGTPMPVVLNRAYPYAVAADSHNVYWIDQGDAPAVQGGTCATMPSGDVLRVSLLDGAVVTLASPTDVPSAIAAADGSVYWAELGAFDVSLFCQSQAYHGDGSINSLSTVAGAKAMGLAGLQHQPRALAVDADAVYWVNGGSFSQTGGNTGYQNDGAVVSSTLAGGSPTTLVSKLSSEPSSIAIDGSNVYWSTLGTFDASGTLVEGTGGIYSLPLGGGTVATLATGLASPLAVAVIGDTLVWANAGTPAKSYSDGSIESVALPGGTPVTLVGPTTNPVALAPDGTGGFYWASYGHFTFATYSDRDGAIYHYTP